MTQNSACYLCHLLGGDTAETVGNLKSHSFCLSLEMILGQYFRYPVCPVFIFTFFFFSGKSEGLQYTIKARIFTKEDLTFFKSRLSPMPCPSRRLFQKLQPYGMLLKLPDCVSKQSHSEQLLQHTHSSFTRENVKEGNKFKAFSSCEKPTGEHIYINIFILYYTCTAVKNLCK